MQRYEYIKKEWIVSPAARRVYRTSALVSLTLIPLLAANILDGPISLFKPLLFVAVLGTAVTQVGMEFFLLRFDQSSPLLQIVWFCILLLPPVGPAFYCFMGYSRSSVFKTASSGHPEDLLH